MQVENLVIIQFIQLALLIILVRVEGLEPTHLAALDPKSSVSTNFTTPAAFNAMANIGLVFIKTNLSSKKKIFFADFPFQSPYNIHLLIQN